jgi:ankyrin repeat protein
MVALLVRNGADWTFRDVEGIPFPFNKHVGSIIMDENTSFKKGFTALHIAIQFGCTPVAAYLIAMGQSPDELDTTRMVRDNLSLRNKKHVL